MKNIPFNQKIHTFIKKHMLLTPNTTIVVGLSGGPDSVCMLSILNQLKVEYNLIIIAAHVDHGWRAESAKEVQFCRELCDRMGVRFVTQKLSNLSVGVKFNGSREEYARKIRRQFFEHLAKEYNADAIALGHHADDQKETFFIRLIRGASLTGLAGMDPKCGLYIRPLLDCSKREIMEYLTQNSVSYLTDPSNDSDDYLRNRIRHNLLPVLDQVDTRAQQNFMKVIERLQNTEDFLVQHTNMVWKSIAHKEGDIWQVDCAQLLAQHEVMRQRLIMHWLILEQVPCVPTQRFFAEIERFLQGAASKTHQIHNSWSLKKHKNMIHMYKSTI